jgi:hypothetical protein
MLRYGALLSVAAMACGGPSIAFSDLDQALQEARCERLARCGLFPDEVSCAGFFRVVTDVSVAAAIGAQKVTYDGTRAKQCIDALSKQSCDLSAHDSRIQPAVCAAMFNGTLAGGAACSINIECASGTCELPMTCPEAGCCVGACRASQAPDKVGGACAKDHDCANGLVCAGDMTCHALAKATEDCTNDHECADGLGCINPLATMPGTCRALPHLGEPCPYLRCADENLRCDEASTHSCVLLGLTGATCATSTECSPYLACDLNTHTCQELPTLGMTCVGSCQGESFCGPTGTCIAPQANGTPCSSFGQCASYYCEAGAIFDSCNDPPACF